MVLINSDILFVKRTKYSQKASGLAALQSLAENFSTPDIQKWQFEKKLGYFTHNFRIMVFGIDI